MIFATIWFLIIVCFLLLCASIGRAGEIQDLKVELRRVGMREEALRQGLGCIRYDCFVLLGGTNVLDQSTIDALSYAVDASSKLIQKNDSERAMDLADNYW